MSRVIPIRVEFFTTALPVQGRTMMLLLTTTSMPLSSRVYTERLGHIAGTDCQSFAVAGTPALDHDFGALGRFNCANQDRSGRTFFMGHNVETRVDSVAPIDICGAWRRMHDAFSAHPVNSCM